MRVILERRGLIKGLGAPKLILPFRGIGLGRIIQKNKIMNAIKITVVIYRKCCKAIKSHLKALALRINAQFELIIIKSTQALEEFEATLWGLESEPLTIVGSGIKKIREAHAKWKCYDTRDKDWEQRLSETLIPAV